MKRLLTASAFLVVALLGASSAMAAGREGGHSRHGGGWHGDRGHSGHSGHGGHWSGSIGISLGGPGWWGVAPYGYGYPYLYGHPYGYGYGFGYPYAYGVVAPQPIVYTQAPPVEYAPPAQAETPATSNYWFYCVDPAGYHPYVKNCNKTWMTVIPQSESGTPTAPQLAP